MFRAMFKEGLLYYRYADAQILYADHLPTQCTRYSVIGTITLIFTMMVIFAEPSVRNITGQYVPPSPPSPRLSNCTASSLPFCV